MYSVIFIIQNSIKVSFNVINCIVDILNRLITIQNTVSLRCFILPVSVT